VAANAAEAHKGSVPVKVLPVAALHLGVDAGKMMKHRM
jgi:hypothetical protein